MRSIAILLSLCLTVSAAAQAPTSTAAAVDISTEPFLEISTITVTAPRQQDAALKAARAGGAGVAASGLGILAYILIFDTGPIGWAAGLMFFGGMTAYLSHRRLHGHDDMSPDESRKTGPATSAP
ncbi:MAG: hypothetical protein ACHQ49_03435 [Elusimicrobiota bacterium]